MSPDDHTRHFNLTLFANHDIPVKRLETTDLFCNTELNMESIQAVGFDMDYTLAQYKTEFDLLAYEGAKEKLIKSYNYPEEIRALQYQPGLCRRGCLLDTERGNMLKLDQHRYPRIVEHGLTPMSSQERKSIYRDSYQEYEAYNNPEFINLDTPFLLVDAVLFIQLVDMKDRCNDDGSILKRKKYSQIWSDLRKCISRCHTDGTIKLVVAQNPSKYIYDDSKRKLLLFFLQLHSH
jgi:HAD superfamily 5'-nucleotidase-like hydrolase